jgi:hypothetical protein
MALRVNRAAALPFSIVLLFAAVGPLLAPWPGASGADAPAGKSVAKDDDEDDDATDVLGSNAACYVCHTSFVKEDLARVHLAEKIGCVKCHGLSAAHANDEHIGATKPDILYPRDKVDANCRECHEKHDVSARKVVQRFVDRKLSPACTPICTECHGTHKIDRAKK